MDKTVYLIFTCDIQKSYDSMRLIGIQNDWTKVISQINELINNDIIECCANYKKNFLTTNTVDEINNLCTYVYVYKGHIGQHENNGGYLI